MVTNTLKFYHLHLYDLLDPGASLFFVTPYITIDFEVSLEILAETFSVSTPVGESIIARWLYRNFPIMIS